MANRVEGLLDGEQPDGAWLEALLADARALASRENLHHDFKGGAWLTGDGAKERKDPRERLRKYLAGFANASGGMLVLGVNNDTLAVEHLELPGNATDPTNWAANALGALRPQLVPDARIHAIDHGGKRVLVVAVARAPHAVYVLEDGAPAYYFRFGESTFKAPEYLVNDLLLGRRQHPRLRAANFRPPRAANAEALSENQLGSHAFEIAFDVINDGLATAREVRVGLVQFKQCARETNLDGALATHVEPRPAPPGLEQSLRGQLLHDPWQNHTGSQSTLAIPPFGKHPVSFPKVWAPASGLAMGACAALYLLADGSPPIMYEVQLEMLNADDANVAERGPLARPRVGWYRRSDLSFGSE